MVFIEHNSLKSLKFFRVRVQGPGPGFRSSRDQLEQDSKIGWDDFCADILKMDLHFPAGENC